MNKDSCVVISDTSKGFIYRISRLNDLEFDAEREVSVIGFGGVVLATKEKGATKLTIR